MQLPAAAPSIVCNLASKMAMSSEITEASAAETTAIEAPDVMLSLSCMELSTAAADDEATLAEAEAGTVAFDDFSLLQVLLVSVFFLFGEEDDTVAVFLRSVFFSSW